MCEALGLAPAAGESLKALLQQDSSLSLICLVTVVKMSHRRNLKREAIVWLPFQRHGSS